MIGPMINDRVVVTIADRWWPGSITAVDAGRVKVFADNGDHRWYPIGDVSAPAVAKAWLVAEIAESDLVTKALRKIGDRAGARASERAAHALAYELIHIRHTINTDVSA